MDQEPRKPIPSDVPPPGKDGRQQDATVLDYAAPDRLSGQWRTRIVSTFAKFVACGTFLLWLIGLALGQETEDIPCAGTGIAVICLITAVVSQGVLQLTLRLRVRDGEIPRQLPGTAAVAATGTIVGMVFLGAPMLTIVLMERAPLQAYESAAVIATIACTWTLSPIIAAFVLVRK